MPCVEESHHLCTLGTHCIIQRRVGGKLWCSGTPGHPNRLYQEERPEDHTMAGNIIPAIATTNAVIAGLIVIEALKVLSKTMDKCKTVYMTRFPNARKKLLVPCVLIPPNPNCYVCADKPEVTIKLNTNTTTVRTLQDKILKSALGMIAPDVEIQDGKGTILISSEEGETEDNMPRMLSEFSIIGGSRLKADDFLQNYELVINIQFEETLEEEAEFEVVGKLPVVHKEAEAKSDQKENQSAVQAESHDQVSSTNGNGEVAGTSQESPNDVEDDDFMILEDENEVGEQVVEDDKKMEISNDGDSRKRKLSEEVVSTTGDNDTPVMKKLRVSNQEEVEQDNEDIVILDD